MSAVSFAIPGGWISALALALAIGAVAAWVVREGLREPNPRARALLVSLRVLTAVLVWLIAVQPSWVSERLEQSEGRLVVLVDRSRSMSLPRGEETRAARVRALLQTWEGEGRDVSLFAFGEGLRAMAPQDAATEPDDDASRLEAALAALLAEGEPPGAVVVVSDGSVGAVNPAPLRQASVRVHGVAVGETELRDDAIALIEADPVGFLRRPARVRVVIRTLGGSGGPIPVTLRRGDALEREVVAIPDDEGVAELEIPFTPTRLGRAVYRVSIPSVPGDAVPENNERAFLVRVTRDKLRVLLVAGQPSFDQRFLRAFLKRDPATDLISFFILRNTSDMTMAGQDELALIPFPTDELFHEHLGSFDLVIFQNFEFGPYQMAGYLPRIRDYVQRGGSFAMIGGPLSFHSGGYAETPIAEILPVDLPPPGTPEAQTLVTDAFAPRLTPAMERHPLVELLPDPARNVEAWGRLSDLHGANVVTRVRPGASVLLEHPRARMSSGGALPVLVVGGAGEGRTLAFTTDTSWRWGITTGGATGDASGYERFWDRAIRWLARDPSLEPARLTTDRERYGPGARARLRAHLRDPRYVPHAEAAVTLRISAVGGAAIDEVTARTDGEGRLETALELPTRPGAYRVGALLDGEEEAIAEEWVVVEAGGDELADPRAHPETLRALADATGGGFAELNEAPSILSYDASRTRSMGVVEEAPFGGLVFFLLCVGALVLEWVVRRRLGRR